MLPIFSWKMRKEPLSIRACLLCFHESVIKTSKQTHRECRLKTVNWVMCCSSSTRDCDVNDKVIAYRVCLSAFVYVAISLTPWGKYTACKRHWGSEYTDNGVITFFSSMNRTCYWIVTLEICVEVSQFTQFTSESLQSKAETVISPRTDVFQWLIFFWSSK